MNQSLDNEQLTKLIQTGENEFVEFKLEDEFQTVLADVLMSQANTGQACFLIIGVEDHPVKVRGVINVKAVTDKLVNAARQVTPSLLPYLDIASFTLHNKTVVVASLPDALPKVYHVGGKYLRRRGSQKIPINAEELLRLLYQRGGEHYEDQPMPQSSLDDINWEQVDKYLERRRQYRSSRIPPDTDRLELLRKLGVLTVGDVPTVACILFFGRDPQVFFPMNVIKAARFMDTGVQRFLDQEIIGGTIPDMIDAAFNFVQRNTRHGASIVGLQRFEEDEYPAEAVREILANACVHRDLTITDATIRCQVFSNRIEIDSPGGLLPGVTTDNLMSMSRLRNRKLAELLYQSGYIEAQGTGIRRVVELMQQSNLPGPRFQDHTISLFVTLLGPEHVTLTSETAADQTPSTSSTTQNLNALPFTATQLEGLNQRQRRFLVSLVNAGNLTREDFEQTFQISSRTAKNDLKELKD